MALFKVAHGYHLAPDPDHPGKDKEVPPGTVIDSDIDLVACFGQKFERLPDYPAQVARPQPASLPPQNQVSQNTPVQAPTPELAQRLARLEQMSVKDLQGLAAAEEIDLKGQTNKNEIIKLIRAELTSAVA